VGHIKDLPYIEKQASPSSCKNLEAQRQGRSNPLPSLLENRVMTI
jgi:hypothetical protein